MIGHLIRVGLSLVREWSKGRSPRWESVEHLWKKAHPTCASCGSKSMLQVHHIVPFAIDPQLELDFTNLLTLCMGKYECHFKIGHGGSWNFHNPKVVSDSAEVLATPDIRSVIETRARINRVNR